MTIGRLYELRKERWEDERPKTGKKSVTVKRAGKKKTAMNWNGLKPKQ